MSHSPFRFLHASDLHLERPLAGVTEAPDHLRSLFLEAPYRSAERMFDAALAERVDFLVHAGDVLDATLCGPRGPIFLIEQFRRLKQAGIAVYWAGGQVDAAGRWPADLPLPDNVRMFPQDRAEHVVHQRDGLSVCDVVGQSNSTRKFVPSGLRTAPGRLSIAVAYGQADAAQLKKEPIAYWALGGKHRTSTHTSPRQMAHYPGTPQGRRPAESGPHGCTLVEVDAAGQLRTRRVACDVVRWQTLEVRVDEHTRRDQLEDLLRERLREQRAAESAHDLLITWAIVGHGPLWSEVRRGGLAVELLQLLRNEFGGKSPAAWTVALSAQPPACHADSMADQETLLGDYLRLVRQHQTHSEQPLELARYVQRRPEEVPANLWRLEDLATRQQVLREAAALGVELLHGEGSLDTANEVRS